MLRETGTGDMEGKYSVGDFITSEEDIGLTIWPGSIENYPTDQRLWTNPSHNETQNYDPISVDDPKNHKKDFKNWLNEDKMDL